ncbi:hypothetical protein M2347_003675 [Chryseobacterium sp. H1D6B]|uniref:hypothetical protein n=1 Tax=Chryseobacterium sp. H1D6B TaxID=2940588 RepID=UPI0015CC9146|nr:hypothetical protein [Chryseobacterium sp. H1D6B]MDH6253948.1 hypothetical protein [Chryseobacterium sp. H1D6B]
MLNKLKSKYEDQEIQPSSDLWSRIEQELEEKPDLELKKPFQWWKYAAAVIVFLISIGTGIYFNQNDSKIEKNTIAETNVAKKENQNSGPALENKDPHSVKTASELSFNNKDADHFNTEKRAQALAYSDKKRKPDLKTIKPQNAAVIHKNTIQTASDDHFIKSSDIIKPEEKIIADNSKLAVTTEKLEHKSSKYIQASDLLAGREYDKLRAADEKAQYVRINFSKLKPRFSQVVTLGVTVHSDTK